MQGRPSVPVSPVGQDGGWDVFPHTVTAVDPGSKLAGPLKALSAWEEQAVPTPVVPQPVCAQAAGCDEDCRPTFESDATTGVSGRAVVQSATLDDLRARVSAGHTSPSVIRDTASQPSRRDMAWFLAILFATAAIIGFIVACILWCIERLAELHHRLASLLVIVLAIACYNGTVCFIAHRRCGSVLQLKPNSHRYIVSLALTLVVISAALVYWLVWRDVNPGHIAKSIMCLNNVLMSSGVLYSFCNSQQRLPWVKAAPTLLLVATTILTCWVFSGLLLEARSFMHHLLEKPGSQGVMFLCGMLACGWLLDCVPTIWAIGDTMPASMGDCMQCCKSHTTSPTQEFDSSPIFCEPLAAEQEMLCDRHTTAQYVFSSAMSACVAVYAALCGDSQTCATFFVGWTLSTRVLHGVALSAAHDVVKLAEGNSSSPSALYRARRRLALFVGRYTCHVVCENAIVPAAVLGLMDIEEAAVVITAKIAPSFVFDTIAFIILRYAKVNAPLYFWKFHANIPVVCIFTLQGVGHLLLAFLEDV